MEKFSLDRDWKFYNGDFELSETKTHTECYMAAKAGGAIGAASPDFDKSDWETVNLPHDWAVYNEFEEKWGPSQGYKKRGKAWYSKRFRLDEIDRDKQILIEFEGISSYATVYLNGSVIGRNFCGYNSFVVDATDMALYGDQVNDLVVFVDATQIEGWWYEGAGIYRHVNLYKKNKLHIAHWGVFVHPIRKTVDVWDAATDTTIENSSYENKNFRLKTYILDKEDNIVGKDEKEFSVAGGSKIEVNQSILTYTRFYGTLTRLIYTQWSVNFTKTTVLLTVKKIYSVSVQSLLTKTKDSSLTADTFLCTALATIKTTPVSVLPFLTA